MPFKLSTQFDLTVFVNRIASLHPSASFNSCAHLSTFISVGSNPNLNCCVSPSNLFLWSCFKETFLGFRYRLHANFGFGITIIVKISNQRASTSSSAVGQGASKC
jgi:hypothetical protein